MQIAQISVWWWIKVPLNLGIIVFCLFCQLNEQGATGVFFWLGEVMMVTGASFNLWHYYALKQRLACLEDPNQLVTDVGFFRWVRHPMYFGEWILIVGCSALCLDWRLFAALLFSTIVLQLLCRAEDRALRVTFGDDHVVWSRRTKHLFPGIW